MRVFKPMQGAEPALGQTGVEWPEGDTDGGHVPCRVFADWQIERAAR
jgi:hypothetical protein